MSSNISSNNTLASILDTVVVIQVSFYVAIAVVGTTGNLILCARLLHKKHRKTSEYFVLNLAFTDLMTCAVSIPLDIVDILTKTWPFGAFLCKVIYPLQTVLISVSVGTLTCMALERHRVIIQPFKARPKGSVINTAVLLVWSLSIVLLAPYIAVLENEGPSCIESWPEENHPKVFTMCVFVFLYAIPLCIITPAYVRVAFYLRSRSRQLRKLSVKQGRNFNIERLSRQRTRTNIRVVKTFSLAAAAFALCLLPYQVMWLWYDFGNGGEWSHFSDALVFANAIVYLNSLIDPFIFGSFSARLCWRQNCTESILRCFNIGEKDRRKQLARNNAVVVFHADRNCNTLKQPETSVNGLITYMSAV